MEPMLVVTHNNYLGRIKVSGPNYDLVISDLKMEDAGDYLADINTHDSLTTITKRFNLQVYRKLWKDIGLDFLFICFLQIFYPKNICISGHWVT